MTTSCIILALLGFLLPLAVGFTPSVSILGCRGGIETYPPFELSESPMLAQLDGTTFNVIYQDGTAEDVDMLSLTLFLKRAHYMYMDLYKNVTYGPLEWNTDRFELRNLPKGVFGAQDGDAWLVPAYGNKDNLVLRACRGIFFGREDMSYYLTSNLNEAAVSTRTCKKFEGLSWCSSSQYTCDNDKCITGSYECDGYNDCGDYSDERHCVCLPTELKCVLGGCIPSCWQCNGRYDCYDGSDELGCNGTSGPVIIVGGGGAPDVETFNTPALPDFPTSPIWPTLSLVGTAAYACGGRFHTQSCHRLDTSNKTAHWTLLANKIPVRLSAHTEAVIGKHIWLVQHNTLFDLNTDTDEFVSHALPVKVDRFSCAVSNNTHSYIIGAGEDKNEIWLNSEASSPEHWHRVANMSTGRTWHACLWVDNNIFITGGWDAANMVIRADVEVLDTATNTVASIGSLVGGRRTHKMMLHGGKPAVIGGTGDGRVVLASIATYDAAADKWETSNNTMKRARSGFGLAQFRTI